MNIVIFDMDGTLSSSKWRQELADAKLWTEYHELVEYDAPIPSLLMAVNLYLDLGFKPVVFTARMDRDGCRGRTVNWLHRYDVTYFDLWLRKEGDPRQGTAVKAGMLKEFRQLYPHANVVRAFDDQERFREVYTSAGVRFTQVDDPGIDPPDLTPAEARRLLDDRLAKGVVSPS